MTFKYGIGRRGGENQSDPSVEGLTTIEQGRDQFDSMGGWVCFQVIMDPVDKADPAL